MWACRKPRLRALRRTITPTGVERRLGVDELIVSKTDAAGRIRYTNSTFAAISGFSEDELLGAPHSIVRHPEMPRAVFKLLWDTVSAGQELFAYVVNLCRNGDHYWVLAHVTPSFDEAGAIVGYHSNRRAPSPDAVAAVRPLYATLLEIERRSGDRAADLRCSAQALQDFLREKGTTYERFIFSL